MGSDTGGLPKRVPRVGLVAGSNGVPLCVLYFSGITRAFHREFRSFEQVEASRGQSDTALDASAWRHVEHFFQAGGKQIHVLGLSLGESEDVLKAMMGVDGGVARRTGIQSVRSWEMKADLLVIPQATELLEGQELLCFLQKVGELVTEVSDLLFLMDLPKRFSAAEAEAFTKGLFYSDAALFHPWLIREDQAVPPSIAMAAWFQRADAEVGIQEMASQITLPSPLVPLKEFGVSERRQLLDARINTFLVHASQTQVWGGYTLADCADWKARLIPLRRSTSKLRIAAEQLCEPYVLEAVDENLPVNVDSALQNFLRSVRRIFNRDLQQPFTTSVEVVSQEGEERLLVELNYALPHSAERFSLEFVA